jgi:hypothetical protein
MARIKFSKYDPQNGHLIDERELAHFGEASVFEILRVCYEVVTRRNEPDGSITGEVFSGENDTVPAYKYKITFIEE